jgi:hypothetical protein
MASALRLRRFPDSGRNRFPGFADVEQNPLHGLCPSYKEARLPPV